MRYVLLIYGEESWTDRLTEEELSAHMQRWGEYDQAMRAAGVGVAGEALDRTAAARTVRARNGRPLVSGGPFAETREQLGGYYLLDVENLDEAIKWAQRCPGVRYGTIELRPIQEYEQG
jgi:hypothetical protein